MKPATWPRGERRAERLMVLDPETGALAQKTITDLPMLLDEGDVVVVNDAATLPASFVCTIHGEQAELRLACFEGETRFRAVVFGSGDHRLPTEDRGPAPRLEVGEIVILGRGLEARVVDIDRDSPRLIGIEVLGPQSRVWSDLVTLGRPIQYAYVGRPLSLFHVQTSFAGRPWSVEMPSAGRPLDWRALEAMRQRKVEVVSLTHGAGLSSTGDPTLDARLPLRERYEIPSATIDAVQRAKARGSRVVAIGTSVVRALESSARRTPNMSAGLATTDLRIDATVRPRVVDAVFTGMHEPGTSHFALLEGFASKEALLAACDLGTREGFLLHEFGDSMIVIGSRRPRLPEAA